MPCVDCPYSSEDSNWCDKVGGEHYAYGWCYDRESSARNTRRVRHKSSRTRAERRYNTECKDKRLKRIISDGQYLPSRGYYKHIYNYETHEYDQMDYIVYPQNSNLQKFLKKLTSRKLRHIKDVPNYNKYRRYLDYYWTLY